MTTDNKSKYRFPFFYNLGFRLFLLMFVTSLSCAKHLSLWEERIQLHNAYWVFPVPMVPYYTEMNPEYKNYDGPPHFQWFLENDEKLGMFTYDSIYEEKRLLILDFQTKKVTRSISKVPNGSSQEWINWRKEEMLRIHPDPWTEALGPTLRDCKNVALPGDPKQLKNAPDFKNHIISDCFSPFIIEFRGTIKTVKKTRMVGWPVPTGFKAFWHRVFDGDLVILDQQSTGLVPLATITYNNAFVDSFADLIEVSGSRKNLLFYSKKDPAHPVAYFFRHEAGR